MISEFILVMVIAYGCYWLGWTHAKEQQRDLDQIDRFEKLAIEFGRKYKGRAKP